MHYLDVIGLWIRTSLNDGWCWVAALNLQEWLLLLGATSAAGFMCMRGFGSRSNY